MTTDSESATSPSVRVVQDPEHQEVSDPVTFPSSEAEVNCSSLQERAQARGSHGDLSSCEAVLTQKLKNLELQNTLPGQADMGYHKSLALDPSCLLTPPNTPQGMELAELEADLQEGTRQQKKGNFSSGDRFRKARTKPTYCTDRSLSLLLSSKHHRAEYTAAGHKHNHHVLSILFCFLRFTHDN